MSSPKGSHLVFKEARSKDKTLKIWDGMYHEIFNEIGKERVIRVACDWLDARISQ